jgi:hypothetical protein
MGRIQECLILSLIAGVGLVAACKGPAPPVVKEESGIASCSKSGEYFPDASAVEVGQGLHFGASQIAWESEFLRRMNEPSLYACSSTTDEAQYRFLWDRSRSETIAARLAVHRDGTGVLVVRKFNHIGLHIGLQDAPSDRLNLVTLDKQIAVSASQVTHALNLFRQIQFRHENPEPETTDGSDWIFESRVGGQYRLVDFRNGQSKPARDFGLYLVLELANISMPEQAIY